MTDLQEHKVQPLPPDTKEKDEALAKLTKFARWVLRQSQSGKSFDDVIDHMLNEEIAVDTHHGFNPELHEDDSGRSQEGDVWYVLHPSLDRGARYE